MGMGQQYQPEAKPASTTAVSRGKSGTPVTGACDTCKQSHHACSQERPKCARCTRLNHDCVYKAHKKPGRKRLTADSVSGEYKHADKRRKITEPGISQISDSSRPISSYIYMHMWKIQMTNAHHLSQESDGRLWKSGFRIFPPMVLNNDIISFFNPTARLESIKAPH